MMNRIRCIDGTTLKIVALLSMLVDHVGDMFFPEKVWMRAVGRLAMPIFALGIAEGYQYTHDRKKYLMRLGIFALISEIPFDLAFSGRIDFGHQNIMLTFFLAVVALMAYDRLSENGKNGRMIGVAAVFAIALLALVLGGDYTVFGVISVFIFYALREREHWQRMTAAALFLAVTRTIGYYSLTILCLIPLLLYDGKKGKGLKYLFYLFYPGHLLILFLIKRMMGLY